MAKSTEKLHKHKRVALPSVIRQMHASQGNISHAARAMGVDRSKLHERIKATPELLEIVHSYREVMVDNAESALHAAVIAKEAWAVCFTLKCLGKLRGYVERQEMEHSGNITATIPVLNVILTEPNPGE